MKWAAELSKKWGGESTEWKLSTDQDLEQIRDKTRYYIKMDINGNTEVISEAPDTNLSTLCELHRFYGITKLDIYCWANNKQHAVKIANEKRIQLIENGEWDRVQMNEVVFKAFLI